MCSDQQHAELMQALARLAPAHTGPIDQDIMISDNNPWRMDYRSYKHVFMWLPSTLTLVMDDYGSGAVQAQVWINLGLRPGTSIKTSGQSTLTLVRLRFTDEEIP